MWRLALDVAIDQLGCHSGKEVYQVAVLALGAVRTSLIEGRNHIAYSLMNTRIVGVVEVACPLDALSQQVPPRPLTLRALEGVLGMEGSRTRVDDVMQTRCSSLFLVNEDVELLLLRCEELAVQFERQFQESPAVKTRF